MSTDNDERSRPEGSVDALEASAASEDGTTQDRIPAVPTGEKPCPSCYEEVQARAIRCRHCQALVVDREWQHLADKYREAGEKERGKRKKKHEAGRKERERMRRSMDAETWSFFQNVLEPAPQQAALVAQLQRLSSRSEMYATRLWALPFLYATGVVAALALLYKAPDTSDVSSSVTIGGATIEVRSLQALLILGLLVAGIMWGIRTALSRALTASIRIDQALGLEGTVKKVVWRIDVPTFSVVGVIMVWISLLLWEACGTQ